MTEAELAAIRAAILATIEVHSIAMRQMETMPEVLDQIRLRFLLVSARQFMDDLESLLERDKGEENGEA